MKELEFESSSGPVDEELVIAFESLIGNSLPHAYREFIKTTNGGTLSARNNRFIVTDHPYFDPQQGDLEVIDFTELTSEAPQSVVLSKAWRYGKHAYPPGTAPIASDSFGNKFLLGVAEPIRDMVYFWEHDFAGISSSSSGNPFENVPKIADSFEEFVDALVEAKK